MYESVFAGAGLHPAPKTRKLCNFSSKSCNRYTDDYEQFSIVKTPTYKNIFMKNAPYVLAAILVILWLVGFLLLNVGSIVHLLLVLAGVMVALKLIGEAEFF
jgi:Family of unknown function (DUF5670)